MNSTQEIAAVKLPIFMCLLIDLPPGNKDCSTNIPQDCISCGVRSDYFSGESVNDYSSTGHTICLLLWILSGSVGFLGILGNVLVITVLTRRSGSNKGFDFLLIVLACFDIICCSMAVFASTGHVVYLGNWSGRGIGVLYVFYLSWIMLLFGRSASQFMTVAITIERYLVITFPLRSAVWFTATKTKLLAIAVLVIAVLLSIPRSTSRYVLANPYPEIPTLQNLEYIIGPTKLTRFWYEHLGSVHYQIDFWLPLPLLLVFNFLSYLEIRKMTRRRKEMNLKQRSEIQAVQMFLPVAIVLLFCNFGPISMFVQVHFLKILYREMYMLTIFSIGFNSAVNFLIYYYRGASFRAEAAVLLREWLTPTITAKTGDSKKQSVTSTWFGSGSSMEFELSQSLKNKPVYHFKSVMISEDP